MDNISDSNLISEKRHLAVRLTVSILWFFPVIILMNMIVGGFVGGIASSQLGNAGFDQGYQVGQDSARRFFELYGGIVFIVAAIIWLVLCFKGILPGTSKFKRKKIKDS